MAHGRHENIPTRPAFDWAVTRIYPRVLRSIGPSREYTRAYGVRLARHENIPARPAFDWAVTRIYPRVRRSIGPSREYTRASCVRLVRPENIRVFDRFSALFDAASRAGSRVRPFVSRATLQSRQLLLTYYTTVAAAFSASRVEIGPTDRSSKLHFR
eukprot:8628046-Pyramimonas_sp.AAC.1